MAGATTVGVGTALFYDPLVCPKINDGIATTWPHRMSSVSELIGSLERHGARSRRAAAEECSAHV